MSTAKLSLSQRRWYRIARWGVMLVLLAYVSVCGYFYWFQEQLLLKPNADPTGGCHSELHELEYQLTVPDAAGDPARIHYRRYLPKNGEPTKAVFYLHGNKGNMDKCEWEIEFLIEHGYEVWTMDYRGFGDSIGTMSEAALQQDALCVYDRIREEVGTEQIVIWGRSFGSGIAASVASATQYKPSMLVLETPYWSLTDVIRQKHPYLPEFVIRYEMPTFQFLKSVNCPIHLIHGTKDEEIPANSSDRLFELCQNEGVPVRGYSIMCGKHNLRGSAQFKEVSARVFGHD